MYTQSLIDAGLTGRNARVYDYLLQQGQSQASKIGRILGISRPLVYRSLDELIAQSLVEKIDGPKKVSVFIPRHPSVLKTHIEEKQQALNHTANAIEGSMDDFISAYNLSVGKPGIRVIEGLRGLRALYTEINNKGKDIKLIRSPFDNDLPELKSVLKTQIKQQVERGITAYVIAPLKPHGTQSSEEKDVKRNIVRRTVPVDSLRIPAQIIVFENAVGITSFRDTLMTTIIENKDIHETFDKLFEYLWETSEADDKKLRKRIQEKKAT